MKEGERMSSRSRAVGEGPSVYLEGISKVLGEVTFKSAGGHWIHVGKSNVAGI